MDFKIDFENTVISQALVTHDGVLNWPPPPLPFAAAPKPVVKETKKDTQIETLQKEAKKIKKKRCR